MAPPSILELVSKSFTQTLYDVKWVPQTAKLVTLGTYPAGTGTLQVLELCGADLQVAVEARPQEGGLRCGSMCSSAGGACQLATGGFDGGLSVWDLERLDQPVFQAAAHKGIVYQLHILGSQEACGPIQVATAGKDGWVRVWDPRQQPEAPVASFAPRPGATALQQECWCVAIGNACSEEGPCVLAGYAGGELRMFDLRSGTQRWSTNVGRGVCGVQFDRPDIPMNKFAAACMDSQLCIFDARTQHPSKGYARLTQQLPQGATLWSVQHLPQNRDVCMVAAGDGSLSLHKYHYPDKRTVLDAATGQQEGVVGSLQQVCDKTVSGQPVAAFDWSADKAGLWASVAYDQYVRIGQVAQISQV